MLPPIWGDDSPGQVDVIVRGDLLLAIDDAGKAARFFRQTPGTGVSERCVDFTEPFAGQPIDLTPAELPVLAAIGDTPIPDIEGSLTFDEMVDGQGLLEFSSLCRGGAGYWALWDEEGFTVVDEAPQPPIGEDTGIRIRCAGPPPRLDLFRMGDEVKVTVSPELVVLDVVGDTSWRLILSRLTAGDSSIVESPTTTGFPPESTVPGEPPTTTTAPPPTTAAPSAGPPAFAPSPDLVFSGRWTLVSMWNNGQAVDLAPYDENLPNLGIQGRRVGGDDGCNNHGAGLFYPTADGTIQIRGGTTTSMGCIDPIHKLYQSGALGADRWGRTDAGNLVLTDGVVITEFTLTETFPIETPTGLSASLDTLWNSESPGDYNSFDTATPLATLTFVVDDDGADVAVLATDACGEFGFAATFEDVPEGQIAFTSLDDANDGEACDLPDEVATALEALARADYFATSSGGIQLWDGPAPLVIFAAEYT